MARYFSVPATRTSRAKKTAENGVPNNPAKPAAMPVTRKIVRMFSMSSFLWKKCPNCQDTAAPIWTATPSRPTEAPASRDSQVQTVMRNTVRRGMRSGFPWETSKMRFMPLQARPPYFWNSHTTRRPASGRTRKVQRGNAVLHCSIRISPYPKSTSKRETESPMSTPAPDRKTNSAAAREWADRNRWKFCISSPPSF